MRRPNFFIVGAPRSGTASMYSYLKQHPEIYCSIDKEPHFFGSDLTVMPGTIREENLYLQLFAGAGDRPRLGEASVWYLSSEKAPHEIKAFSPDAKIIVMLREPAQMANSLYSLYSRTGNEDLPTFEEALAAESDRRQYREGRRLPAGCYFPEGLLYTDAARNAAKVERYFEVFGRGNVFYVLFDDFVRDTAGVYKKALEFLGVDPNFQAELDPAKASQKVRLIAIRQLRDAPPEVKQRMQFKEMKQHDGPPRQPLAPETAARLRELFADDVARLGKAIGRDLSAWTRGESVPPGRSGARLREVLDSVKVLKKIPAEIRAKHERDETLARKFARWQKVKVPNLPLKQVPSNPEWADWFAAERAAILKALDRPDAVCEHFGSTSVPGLPSKNMIDIFVTLGTPPDEGAAEALKQAGYESWGNSPVDPETIWLWKIDGDRSYVIHLCEQNRPWVDEQRALREFLRAHPEERDRYASLKKKLSEEIDQSFLQYTISKMSLSIEMIDRAKLWRASQGAGQDLANRERSTMSL